MAGLVGGAPWLKALGRMGFAVGRWRWVSVARGGGLAVVAVEQSGDVAARRVTGRLPRRGTPVRGHAMHKVRRRKRTGHRKADCWTCLSSAQEIGVLQQDLHSLFGTCFKFVLQD